MVISCFELMKENFFKFLIVYDRTLFFLINCAYNFLNYDNFTFRKYKNDIFFFVEFSSILNFLVLNTNKIQKKYFYVIII